MTRGSTHPGNALIFASTGRGGKNGSVLPFDLTPNRCHASQLEVRERAAESARQSEAGRAGACWPNTSMNHIRRRERLFPGERNDVREAACIYR